MSNYSTWKGSDSSGVGKEENPLQRTYSKFLYQSPLKREDISTLGSYSLNNNSLRTTDNISNDRPTTRSTYASQMSTNNPPISLEHIELREEAINKTSILMLEANREQVKMLKSEIASSAQTIQKLETENRSLTSETTKLREDYVKLKRFSNEQSEQIKNNESEIAMKSRLVSQQAQELDNTKKYLTNALNLEQSKHEETRKDLSAATISINKLNVELETIKSNLRSTCEELKQVRDESQRRHCDNESLKSDILVLQKKLDSLQVENDALHKFRERVSDYSDIKAENASLKGEIEKLDAELEKLTDSLRNVSEENASLKTYLSRLNETVDDLTREKDKTIDENTQLQQELTSERGKVKKSNQELEIEKQKCNDLEATIQDLEKKLSDVSSELDNIQLISKQKDLKIKTLENENEAFSNRVKTCEQALIEANNVLAGIFESPDDMISKDESQPLDTRAVLNTIITGINHMDKCNTMLQETTVPKEKYESVESQLNEGMKKIQDLEGNISELSNHIEAIEKENNNLKSENEDLQGKLIDERKINEEQKRQIQDLNDLVRDLRNELDSNKEENSTQKSKIDSMNEELRAANNRIEEQKYREEEYNNTITMIKSKNEELNKVVEGLRSQLEQAMKDDAQNKARIANLSNVTKEQDKLIEAQQANMAAFKQDKDETIDRLSADNAELKQKVSELESVLEAEKAERLEKAKSRMEMLNKRVMCEEDLALEIQAATPGASTSARVLQGATARGSVYFANVNETNRNINTLEPGDVTPVVDSSVRSSLVQSALTSPSPKLISDISATMSKEELKELIENIDRQHKD